MITLYMYPVFAIPLLYPVHILITVRESKTHGKFLSSFEVNHVVQIPLPMKFLDLAKLPIFQQYLDVLKSVI